jgi:hypothetical protein
VPQQDGTGVRSYGKAVVVLGFAAIVAGCAGNFLPPPVPAAEGTQAADNTLTRQEREDQGASDTTLFEAFNNSDDPNITVRVNKYLWVAALDILNFLPVESVDPFTGVFVTGYGRPPGGGRAYRATVYVTDPALDARSLRVSLQTQGGGPVNAETQRAVEDAILTRARQLRIQDGGL